RGDLWARERAGAQGGADRDLAHRARKEAGNSREEARSARGEGRCARRLSSRPRARRFGKRASAQAVTGEACCATRAARTSRTGDRDDAPARGGARPGAREASRRARGGTELVRAGAASACEEARADGGRP